MSSHRVREEKTQFGWPRPRRRHWAHAGAEGQCGAVATPPHRDDAGGATSCSKLTVMLCPQLWSFSIQPRVNWQSIWPPLKKPHQSQLPCLEKLRRARDYPLRNVAYSSCERYMACCLYEDLRRRLRR